MITSNTINEPLPQEMQQHTYSIMYAVEGSHWWFAGRRRIIESFLTKLVEQLAAVSPRILDVGCGTIRRRGGSRRFT
jgi:hypothetical protein